MYEVCNLPRTGSETALLAIDDMRQRYTVWVEQWPNGWVAQEVSDTGSGGIIAEGLPSREVAVDAAIDFLEQNGGIATLADESQGK